MARGPRNVSYILEDEKIYPAKMVRGEPRLPTRLTPFDQDSGTGEEDFFGNEPLLPFEKHLPTQEIFDLPRQKRIGNLFAHGFEEVRLSEANLGDFLRLLGDGPCELVFRRVQLGGIRSMRCIKLYSSPQNAFDPRYPGLIAVWDLDVNEWRSFYYKQVQSFRRLFKKNLDLGQKDAIKDYVVEYNKRKA